MQTFFAFLFWTFFVLIGYTYVGYPILLWIASRLFAKPVNKGAFEPVVSVILSAFNEEKHIEKKLLNLLNMDYPEDKLEILVGSDGAFDGTDAIISKFRSPRIRFFRFVQNMGKPHVLNGLVQEAHGAILVFTDARQEFSSNAIRELVENFHDPQVGCVSGELYFGEVQSKPIGQGMDAYWKYEKFLRKCESQMGSMLGATGAIYAVRRHLFSAVPTDILVDDMYIPLSIIEKGFRAIFDSKACAFDLVSSKGKEEFKRKVRTLTGNYQIFQLLGQLFTPFKSPIAWQLFSHKFLRLLVPFFLIGLFVSNLFLLPQRFYQIAFLLQVLFYSLAVLESFSDQSAELVKRKGIGYIPYTFCLLNYSAFMGLIQFLGKKQKGTWEKAYV
jgi:poly-beta-1,6-N-acetyl-D-glucosamine synthase